MSDLPSYPYGGDSSQVILFKLMDLFTSFLPWWAVRTGLVYMTLAFPSRFSGSLQHQQAPCGTTLGEQSLTPPCPTSSDTSFGLIHSAWATKNCLRRLRALMTPLSWCRCTGERPTVVCCLTSSFISLLAVPKEAWWDAVRTRPVLFPPIVVSCWSKENNFHRCCTKNCFQTT